MVRALCVSCFLAFSLPAHAGTYDDDWSSFGHALTLMQQLVRIGTQPNPEQGVADLLAGRNHEANQAAASLFAEATADMPEEHKAKMAAIGRDLLAYAAKQPFTMAPSAAAVSPSGALQARKDLNEMGLRYYDEKQFLDAVKRNDALAVQLFVAGQGVDLAARTWDGRSALDIARANGNTQMAELLSRNLPAAH